jgi:hypothetical protein
MFVISFPSLVVVVVVVVAVVVFVSEVGPL